MKFNYPTYIQDSQLTSKLRNTSRLAFGTAAIGGAWGPVDAEESVNTVLYALENGVTVLDTAPAYSNAELFVGKALRQWKGPRPILSTKMGKLKSDRAYIDVYDFSPQRMRQSVFESLDTLGVDHLDIIFLHDLERCPLSQRPAAVELLQQLKSEGLTKMTGFGGKMDNNWFNYVDKKNIDVVMNYNRLDACNLDSMLHDIPLYQKENIAFYLGSALHMGLLGNRFEAILKERPSWISEKDVENAVRAKAISDKHGMTLSTLAHRFTFSIAEIDRVVIGARNLQQLQSTLNDWKLGKLPEDIFNELCQSIL